MKKIFSLILILFFSFSVFSAVNAGNLSSAFGDNFKKTASKAGYDDSKTDPLVMVSSIIQIALSLLGVIFLILVIYGGFLWMTAAGDEGKVDSAKKIITAAVIGLVIILSAYAITWFIFYKLASKTLSS